MNDTNTRSSDTPIDELAMFRMSAQHLIQLVEYYRGAADPRLALAVQRAIKAHVAVTEALVGEEQSALPTEEAPALQEGGLPAPAAADSWVESPWEFLEIPSRTRGRLGPMPRFVPLSPKDAQDDKDE